MPGPGPPTLAPPPTAAKSSKAARKRRKARQKKADSAAAAPAAKPGAKSNFKGERAEFMDHWYYKFLLVKGQPQKTHDTFWRDLYAAYWEKFPWHLPLDRDPYDSMPPPPDETPEVLLEKEDVVTKTQSVRMHYSRDHDCLADLSYSASRDICAIGRQPQGARNITRGAGW